MQASAMYLERRCLRLEAEGEEGIMNRYMRGGRGEGGDGTWIRGRRENEERERTYVSSSNQTHRSKRVQQRG